MPKFTFDLKNEEHFEFLEDAKRLHLGWTDYFRRLINPPASMLSVASNGAISRGVWALYLATAEETEDKDDATQTWLWDVEQTLLWLRAHPYHREAPKKAMALFEDVPKSVQASVKTQLKSIL